MHRPMTVDCPTQDLGAKKKKKHESQSQKHKGLPTQYNESKGEPKKKEEVVAQI
jgi:hypothetical protein